MTRRDALLDALLVILVVLVPRYAPGFLWVLSGGDSAVPDDTVLLITSKWLEAFVILVVAVYLLMRNRLPCSQVGLHLARPLVQIAWAVLCLIATYFYLIATAAVIMALLRVSPELKTELQKQIEFIKSLPIPDMRASALLLVAVAIHEELLFRGILLPWLRRAMGGWTPAVLVSSLIFASLHIQQGWLGMTRVLGISLILSLVFIRSRSLLAVMLAHFAFDFLQLLLARLIDLDQFDFS